MDGQKAIILSRVNPCADAVAEFHLQIALFMRY